MYYIWHEDLTGRLLLAEALAAAERGVRVRILIDDIGTNQASGAMQALAQHPYIEVRIFNPTRARASGLRRGVEMLLRAFSVTRRMHNKAWIADGRVAMVGGRNIGDAYFDAAEDTNFRDMDVLVLGTAVQQTEAVFDAYWNSGLALPIGKLTRERQSEAARQAVAEQLRSTSRQALASPYIQRLAQRLSLFDPEVEAPIWVADARVLADPPQKAWGKKGQNWLIAQLLPVFDRAQQHIEITSPYFIPGEYGTAKLSALAAQGVSVSVLTNSLAATDVAAVHGGYAHYRLPLLQAGVKIWELRPQDHERKISLRGSSNASLHTKAFTVDGRSGFIGSMNLDPRSTSLNTEMGLLFTAPALVAKMEAVWQREIAPARSYALQLGPNGQLQWLASAADGQMLRYEREPEAAWWRRALAKLSGLLPLESQL